MAKRVRVNGVYDTRTIKELKKLHIKHIGFDFRPKSFNFIQSYKAQEFLVELGVYFEKFYLHFSNEKDFVIKKILQDIFDCGINKEQVILEFSDSNNQDFYEQFGVKYIVHLDKNLLVLNKTQFLDGVALHISHLEKASSADQFPSFVNELFTAYPFCKSADSVNLHLDMNWDSELNPNYFDFFNFQFLCVPINPIVEVCYRNVNLTKLASFLQKLPIEI